MGLDKASIAQLKAELAAFPPCPTAPRSELKQLVAELFDEILKMKTLGYSFAEIAEAISERSDFEINPGTLRKYWSAERQQRQSSQKKKKARTPVKARSKAPSQGPAKQSVQVTLQPVRQQQQSSQAELESAFELEQEVRASDEPAVEAARSGNGAEPETESETSTHRPVGYEDDGYDNKMTTGLIREPVFNTIDRS